LAVVEGVVHGRVPDIETLSPGGLAGCYGNPGVKDGVPTYPEFTRDNPHCYFYSRRNLTPRCLARHVFACDLLAASFRRTW